jgi:putative N6-adenine-specific DNA methylase
VVTAPGLEAFTARELEQIELTPSGLEPGGVAFEGTLSDLARANLWLRSAGRILLRLGSFHARALGELERKATLLPWREWLPAGTPVSVRATCKKSRLYHQKAVAERVVAASGMPPVGTVDVAEGEAEEAESPESQLIVVRIFRDECTISLDSSGALLHRRGYRLASAKAPLRENLAAGLLLASEWLPQQPLVDPFCGSGTIPIEAALLARQIPPGLKRDFAFRQWLGWDERWWRKLSEAAREEILPHAPAMIIGADRDAGAIEAAVANAERAGVAGDIEFRCAALSQLEPPAGQGALVSNPPYGVRVGEPGALRDLYARLGQVARERMSGWRLTLLFPAEPLERATGLGFRELFRSKNGGLAVRALRAPVAGTGA